MAHWTEKRKARALVGRALRDRGWTLYGWHEDQSDSMTDYFDPEDWRGVAERYGYVVCVDVSSYDAKASGYRETRHERIPEGDCGTCGGSGVDPSGWTLAAARKDPERYHRETCPPGTVALLANVVSPIPFRPDGRLSCRSPGCHDGQRFRWEERETGIVWPTFQANPPRSSWHVERAGRILAKGTGVYSIADPNAHVEPGKSEQARKLGRLVERIEAATHPRPMAEGEPPAPLHEAEAGGVRATVRPSSIGREGVVEVVFSEKPAAGIRDTLKAHGFRWAKRSGCWYGPKAALPAELAEGRA